MKGSSVIEIRPLAQDDAAAFRAIWLRALREHPEAFGASWEEERERPVEAFAARLRDELGSAERYALGAFAGATLLGIITFQRWPLVKFRHSAQLSGMYVTPEARGRGVGRQLLDQVVARARRLEGLDQIKLAVVAANDAARALYRSIGVVSYGVEPAGLKWNGQRFDLDRMALELSDPPHDPAINEERDR
jgi:ribosomal protein S18 acetylase RimI-like enzyme